MIRKITLFFLVTLSVCASAVAQYSIKSSVWDDKNGMAVELANVQLLSAKDSAYAAGAKTDSRGEFVLSKVKPGNYIIIVSSVGYIKQTSNITLTNKDLVLKRISLVENV
ncbi:MAG: carboxypeptidase-like regulatory domain-containing protein, partial [Paludibacter sp.]|nr:carboxypeptidase-like regulatory domain-containing protein [Paludibacter sp.]